MIEEIIPGNKTRFKIIKTIYENPGINLTALIKKVKGSPNLVLDYVNKLSSYGLIKEEKTKGKKKVHVRNLRANFAPEIAKLVYSLVEMDKKILFFKKYKELRPYFWQLGEIIKNRPVFVLIYGSYTRFAATKDSDVDVLVVGDMEKEKVKRIREIFVTLEKELSLKIETIKQFLKNKDKPLYQNILKEHIILYGAERFIEILEKVTE